MACIDAVTAARIALGLLNLALLVTILFIAYRDYRRVRAPFTLGVMLFGLALLFHTLVMNPIFHLPSCAVLTGDVILVLFLAADAFEAVALSVFLYLVKS